jgi:O-antigen ligase
MITTLSLSKLLNEPQAPMDQAAKILLIISVFFMPISTAATNVFMGLTLLAWFISGGYRKRWESLRINPFAWATAALFLVVCLGSIWSTGNREDILYQIHKYAKLMFMLPAITLMQEKEWRERGLIAFGTAMLLTLALSLLSVVWPLPFVRGTASGPSENHFVFRDHIAQNLMMSFFALILTVKFKFEKKYSNKFIYGLFALLSIIDILFFVIGRTGYVSLAFNAFVFLFFTDSWKERIIAVATIGFIFLFTAQFSTNFNSRIGQAVQEYNSQDEKKLTSVGQRVEFTKKSLQLMRERPLLGFGTGSYRKEFCRVAETEEWCAAGSFHPHNQFLAFGVQLGALGIFCYMAFLLVCAWQAILLPAAQKFMGAGLVATLIADSIFHAPLFLIAEAAFFILLLPVFMTEDKRL